MNFAPTMTNFALPPCAKFRLFCLASMRQPQRHKRLARAAWAEARRISPHVKKEKISVMQKSRAPNRSSSRGYRRAETELALHRIVA
jgi:hypothetical protein